jgi:hypothetical protein
MFLHLAPFFVVPEHCIVVDEDCFVVDSVDLFVVCPSQQLFPTLLL